MSSRAIGPVPALVRAAFLGAFILLFPAAGAQHGQSHLSSDPVVVKARMHVEMGGYREALELLRPLVGNHPDQTDVLFLVGLAAIEASLSEKDAKEEDRRALLDEAISALHAILVGRPELVRVRLELARAFFLKGADDLAAENFEHVLAGDIPPAMERNIRRYLHAMWQRRRLTGHFGVAIAPDSNINAASESEVIHIYGLPFRRGSDSTPKSGLGVSAWGGAEYQHPLDDGLRLRVGGNISVREYAKSLYDQHSLGAFIGPRWIGDENSEFSVLATFQRHWSGGESHSRDLGGRMEAQRRAGDNLSANASVSWRKRMHWASTQFDGNAAKADLRLTWLPTPVVRTAIAFGKERERTDAYRWRNRADWAQAEAHFALPYGFTLGSSVRRRWVDYRGNWRPFTDGRSRKDQEQTLRIFAHNRALTAYGMSPQLILVRERRNSNAHLYEYRRSRAELRFVRQF